MEQKFFSFLFNTVFYCRIPKETIRIPFRGLTMLKSRKLVIKGTVNKLSGTNTVSE